MQRKTKLVAVLKGHQNAAGYLTAV